LSIQELGRLKRQAVIGLLWSLGQSWGVRIITLLHYVVIARFLEPADLGIVTFAITIVACLGSLTDLGMTTWIESTSARDASTLNSAWWSTVFAALLVSGTLIVSASLLADWTARPNLGPVLKALSLTVIFSGVSAIQFSLLKTHFMHRSIAIASLVACSAGSLTGIACVLSGWSYWALVVKALLEGALMAMMLIWFSPWRPSWHFEFRSWTQAVRQSTPILGMRGLEIANQRLDSLLIGTHLGPNALGFYATGQRLYQIAMEGLFSAVNQVSLPLFSRFRSEPHRAADVLLRLVACTSLLSFPIFALMSVTAPDLITVVFGPKWRPAGSVLAVFCLGGVLSSVSYFNAPLLLASGRAKLVFWLSLMNALLNTVGFLLAVPFGVTAVAAAFVLRGFLVYPINLWLVHDACGLSISRYARTLWPATAASALTSLVVWGWLSSTTTTHWITTARLLTSWVTGALLYSLIIFTIFRKEAASAIAELQSMARSTQTAIPTLGLGASDS